MNRLRKGTVPEDSEVHTRVVPRGGKKVQQKRTTGAGLLEEKAKKEEDKS
jgi:hypothetical protein